MTPYKGAEAAAEKLLLVVLQQHAGTIHPVSLELAALAIGLSKEAGLSAAGIIITNDLSQKSINALEQSGLEKVHVYQHPLYYPFIAEYHSAALVHCARRLMPEILLVGATPEGRILAPMAAIPLDTGVTADCTALSIEQPENLLVQTRPAFGGNIMAQIITPRARPQIATVRSGIFHSCAKAENADAGKTRLIIENSFFAGEPAIRAEAEPDENIFTDNNNAPAILALGAGVRAKEDIELFRPLCETLSMELMCSRSLVERGWLPYGAQIGLSGRNVSPELLITLGVSGSVQFMAGIEGARRVIAVNKDPAAPILRIADLPLIGDLYQIASELAAYSWAEKGMCPRAVGSKTTVLPK